MQFYGCMKRFNTAKDADVQILYQDIKLNLIKKESQNMQYSKEFKYI